jgi:ANTAR domain/GAF domain
MYRGGRRWRADSQHRVAPRSRGLRTSADPPPAYLGWPLRYLCLGRWSWGHDADMESVRELARIGLANRDLSDVLQDITEVANRAVPGSESTSITLIRAEKPWTAAHAGQLALDADEMQYQRGYGPCVDAGRTVMVLIVSEMATETRWPDYAAHAAQHGVRSSLSVPLPYQGATIGALNTYATTAGAFDEQSAVVGEEVASYIAVAVANADAHAEATITARQMREAMQFRSVIDMAKGMLIARHGCTPDEAFTLLSQASQRQNRKLRDIAAGIVEGASRKAHP